MQSILWVLSIEKGLRLSDLARRIYRAAPVTKALAERLLEVELVERKDGKYQIPDHGLSVYLKMWALGLFSEDDKPTEEAIRRSEVVLQ